MHAAICARVKKITHYVQDISYYFVFKFDEKNTVHNILYILKKTLKYILALLLGLILTVHKPIYENLADKF